MSDDYKPLNPNSKVIEGRLAGPLYWVGKAYSEIVPSFAEKVKVENRANVTFVCDFAKNKDVLVLASDLYNNSWSIMRAVGELKDDSIVVMIGRAPKEERDNIPRRLFIFRVGDVESKVINTKGGERDATFFSMDTIDSWEKYSCPPNQIGMALRSIVCGSVDPDLAGSPFKSYLTSIIDGTLPKPDIHADHGDTDASDWDDNINF